MIVLDGGRQFVRAEGVARILSELRGWSAIGALLRAPGVRQFARWGYDKFAQNRHRVSAALGVRACAMPERKRPEQLSK